MIVFIWTIGISAAILLLLASVAFFRAKDLFVMNHIVLISNLYIIPAILLAVDLEKFSWISFAKTLAIILLNIISTNLLTHLIAKRALAEKIVPDADFKNKLQ